MKERTSQVVGALMVLPAIADRILDKSFEVGPTRPMQVVASLIGAGYLFWLAVPRISAQPSARDFRASAITLGVGYLFIATLYILPQMQVTVLVGYDSITEFVGSFLFVCAAIWLTNSEPETKRLEDLATLIALGVLLVIAALVKGICDLRSNSCSQSDAVAARLLINVCNGGIVLVLYGQLRRRLKNVHPLVHISILFFAMSELVAGDGDLMKCTPDTFCSFVTLGISWSLLLGKAIFVAFFGAAYNHTAREKPPEARAAAAS